MGLFNLGGSLRDLPRLRDCRRRRVSTPDSTDWSSDFNVAPAGERTHFGYNSRVKEG